MLVPDTLPPVILPVAVIKPAVIKLPPVMLPVTELTPVFVTLPAVTLPVTLTVVPV